jgi:hypothetical protein
VDYTSILWELRKLPAPRLASVRKPTTDQQVASNGRVLPEPPTAGVLTTSS